MQKRILLLGGSHQQIVAIETAKRLGLFCVLCDYLPDNPGQYHADKFYLVSTTDKDAVLEVAQKEHVDYVIAYASDPAAPTAAYVAERMGLPTNPYRSVETLCNKDLFREALRAHGFHTPKALGFRSREDAAAGIGQLALPVIVKPVDSSGSKGVTVVRDTAALSAAIDCAFSYSRAQRIIVEEFIEKKHPYLIGGDIFVSEGRVVLWGLMNCHRDPRVNPLVPVGKSYPPALEPADLTAVKETLQRLVTELGIRFGPMNVELIVDRQNRVFPIDVGPRSGGNMIPDLMSLIFGCDVVELSVRAAMGEALGSREFHGTPYYATLNLHADRAGVLERIEFSPEIERFMIRKCIQKQRGARVVFFSNAADLLGIVFFRFPDEKTMLDLEAHMNEHVRIVLQGDEA